MGRYRPTPVTQQQNDLEKHTGWCYTDLVPPTLVVLFSSHFVVLAFLHLDSRVFRSSMRLQLQVCWGSLEQHFAAEVAHFDLNHESMFAVSYFNSVLLCSLQEHPADCGWIPAAAQRLFCFGGGYAFAKKKKKPFKTHLSSSSGPCLRFSLRFDPNSSVHW